MLSAALTVTIGHDAFLMDPVPWNADFSRPNGRVSTLPGTIDPNSPFPVMTFWFGPGVSEDFRQVSPLSAAERKFQPERLRADHGLPRRGRGIILPGAEQASEILPLSGVDFEQLFGNVLDAFAEYTRAESSAPIAELGPEREPRRSVRLVSAEEDDRDVRRIRDDWQLDYERLCDRLDVARQEFRAVHPGLGVRFDVVSVAGVERLFTPRGGRRPMVISPIRTDGREAESGEKAPLHVRPRGIAYYADGVGLFGLSRIPSDQRVRLREYLSEPVEDLDWIRCVQILYARDKGWDWASVSALLDEAMAALNEDLTDGSVGPNWVGGGPIRRTACNFGLLAMAIDRRLTPAGLLDQMGRRPRSGVSEVGEAPIGAILLEGASRLADFWIAEVEQGAVNALVGNDAGQGRDRGNIALSDSGDLNGMLWRLSRLIGTVRGGDSPEAMPSVRADMAQRDPGPSALPTTEELRSSLRDRLRIIFDMVAQASASIQLGLVREQFELAQIDSQRQAESEARTRQFEKGLALAGTLLLIPTMVATVFGANVNALASGARGSVLGVVGWMVGTGATTAVIVRLLQVIAAGPEDADPELGVLRRLVPRRFKYWLAGVSLLVAGAFAGAFVLAGGSQTQLGATVAIVGSLLVFLAATASVRPKQK